MLKIATVTTLTFICIGILVLVGSSWLYKHSEARSSHNRMVGITQFSIQSLSTLVHLYKHQNKDFPESLQNLIPNYLDKIPKDIWDKDFIYHVENGKAVVMTLGADGKLGGKGLDYDFSNNLHDWSSHFK